MKTEDEHILSRSIVLTEKSPNWISAIGWMQQLVELVSYKQQLHCVAVVVIFFQYLSSKVCLDDKRGTNNILSLFYLHNLFPS